MGRHCSGALTKVKWRCLAALVPASTSVWCSLVGVVSPDGCAGLFLNTSLHFWRTCCSTLPELFPLLPRYVFIRLGLLRVSDVYTVLELVAMWSPLMVLTAGALARRNCLGPLPLVRCLSLLTC